GRMSPETSAPFDFLTPQRLDQLLLFLFFLAPVLLLPFFLTWIFTSSAVPSLTFRWMCSPLATAEKFAAATCCSPFLPLIFSNLVALVTLKTFSSKAAGCPLAFFWRTLTVMVPSSLSLSFLTSMTTPATPCPPFFFLALSFLASSAWAAKVRDRAT